MGRREHGRRKRWVFSVPPCAPWLIFLSIAAKPGTPGFAARLTRGPPNGCLSKIIERFLVLRKPLPLNSLPTGLGHFRRTARFSFKAE